MKRIASEGFNKEKLAFIGTAALLALALYHLLISAPVELVPSDPVSNTPPPGPLDREKVDTRVADVRFYLQEGLINPQTGLAVNRSRKNPFEPLDDFVVKNHPVPTPGPNGAQPPKGFEPPPPPPPPKVAEKEDKKKEFTEKDKFAKVDFSGVMTMNGVTYGLLKSKSGETIQVKEGDYLEDYQYTVAKIEKQAIWVSDEDNQMFLARDTTFDVGGGGSGGEEGDEKAAKKKPAKPAAPKPTAAATPKPTPKPAPQVAQNNNNNQRNNQRGNNSRGNRSGNNNNGNYQNFNSNNNGNRGGY